jgi:hypothetical protein
MKKILLYHFLPITFISFLIMLPSCSDQKTITLKSLLNEMTDRSALTHYPAPFYNLKQFSSYDRKSEKADSAGWFANADYTQFLGEDTTKGRKEYILFNTDGPGAIVRWWMTFAGEGSYNGTVRVYIDNIDKPVIEDSILRVLSGHLLAGEPLSSSVSPQTNLYQRGHNLYLPIPFALHCKITYECKAIKITETYRSPSVYYNICYRQYEKTAKVESFSMNKLRNARDLIDKTDTTLLSTKINKGRNVHEWRKNAEIGAGKSLVVQPEIRNSAISRITLNLRAKDRPQALRSTVLAISFDGLRTVWVPAGDFFGTAYKYTTSSTWNSKADKTGQLESYWLMPFKNSCLVALINYGKQAVDAELQIETTPYLWSLNSLYFGAAWHEYHNIQTAGAVSVGGTGNHRDINFVDISGKGIYAGDAIAVFNTVDAWFGEGDEKIFVDGEPFPSSLGTGTEDYYGYAWCRPELFSHPFIAQPSGSGNFTPGLTINMRYRSLDAIPFKSSISSNIELWHWAPTILNYALTSYFYVMPDYTTNTKPEPRSVANTVAQKRSDVYKPEVDEHGLIEGENLEVVSVDSGTVEVQQIAGIGWSNNGQIWWHGGIPGSKLDLRFIAGEKGFYNIAAALSKAVDYGIIGFEINGKPVGRIFNGYIPEKVEYSKTDLGTYYLNTGENIITIIIKGKDKNAKPGYMAGIDYLVLKPVNQISGH